MTDIEKFVDMVKNSDNIVFGGAGVSTESGIPDFRSTDGLYNQHYKYPPETILSHSFFMDNTEEFYRFYRDKMLALDAQPNMAHIKLAELEKEVKDFVEYKLSTYKVANPTKRSDLVPKSIYAFDIPNEIARVKRYKEYAEYCLKQLEQMQKEG